VSGLVFKYLDVYRWMLGCVWDHFEIFLLRIKAYYMNVLWSFDTVVLDLFNASSQRCQCLIFCLKYDLNQHFLVDSCVLESINRYLDTFRVIFGRFCSLLRLILQTYFDPLTRSSWTISKAVDSVVNGLLSLQFRS